MAVKVALADAQGTFTDAGTDSSALLLDSTATAPPKGAVLFNVTVQVVAAPLFKSPGLQDSPLGTNDADKLIVAVCDTAVGTTATA
jgi:hypothetical protein